MDPRKRPFEMQRLEIVGAVARAYVRMVRQCGALLALAWLPWLFGVLVVDLLAFDRLGLLPSSSLPLWLWQAQLAYAPFLAMIAVAILRFVQFETRAKRAFHVDFRKPVALSSVILAATLLIAAGVDALIDLTVRHYLLAMMSEITRSVPCSFCDPWHPLYASFGLRWLAANVIFVTSYVLIGASVAAASGATGLLTTMLRRRALSVLLFIFLLSLSMIPLKLVYLSAFNLVYPVLDDWSSVPVIEAARPYLIYVLLSPAGTPLNLIDTVLSIVAVGIIFKAAAQSPARTTVANT
jgi:hypothetical protein